MTTTKQRTPRVDPKKDLRRHRDFVLELNGEGTSIDDIITRIEHRSKGKHKLTRDQVKMILIAWGPQRNKSVIYKGELT